MNAKNKNRHHKSRRIANLFVDPGGHKCEFCRMRGITRRAYREVEVDGLDWWLCWDCTIDSHGRIKEC